MPRSRWMGTARSERICRSIQNDTFARISTAMTYHAYRSDHASLSATRVNVEGRVGTGQPWPRERRRQLCRRQFQREGEARAVVRRRVHSQRGLQALEQRFADGQTEAGTGETDA